MAGSRLLARFNVYMENDTPAAAAPSASTIEALILSHPHGPGQLRDHWLAFAAVVIPLLVVVTVVQMEFLPTLVEAPEHGVPSLAVGALVVHAMACLVALAIFMSGSRSLRADAGSDRNRVAVVIAYVRRRRHWVMFLAWAGHVVALIAGVSGVTFAAAPWLLIPLVPSFLLVSLTLRQPPTLQRLASHVRSLRMVQQHREL